MCVGWPTCCRISAGCAGRWRSCGGDCRRPRCAAIIASDRIAAAFACRPPGCGGRVCRRRGDDRARAPDLQIESAKTKSSKSVSPQDVSALIDDLLDESSLASGFKTAMQAERAMAIHFASGFINRPVVGTTQKIGLARTLKWEVHLDDAARQPNYPAAQNILAANPPPPKNIYKYIPSLPSAFSRACRGSWNLSFAFAAIAALRRWRWRFAGISAITMGNFRRRWMACARISVERTTRPVRNWRECAHVPARHLASDDLFGWRRWD